MAYKDWIKKTCLRCEQPFVVTPARADKAKFCSIICRDLANRKRERKTLICEHCDNQFEAIADHGILPRFCSRECFLNNGIRPIEKECKTCGKKFIARSSHGGIKTEDGRRIYCSNICRFEGLKKEAIKTICLNCGIVFKQHPSRADKCCSALCRNKYYRGALCNGTWKGGESIHTQGGYKIVRFKQPGKKSPYVTNIRLIAAEKIGRMLHPLEYILRLNEKPEDDRPENIYICGTVREYRHIKKGKLPWPDRSNLDNYR